MADGSVIKLVSSRRRKIRPDVLNVLLVEISIVQISIVNESFGSNQA
jgi:hypothetical protein